MKRIMMTACLSLLAFATLYAAVMDKSFSEKERTMKNRKDELKTATLGGGCFWCMEPPFEKLDGVIEVISGYSGGNEKNPTYNQVSSGQTGHMEVVQIIYDAAKISYRELLDVYWKQIDPTDEYGQFVDRGKQYRSAIFYHDEEQKRLAEESKSELEESGIFDRPIVTEILEFMTFTKAEDYHQDYYKTNSSRYKYYRQGSGRDRFLEKSWKNQKGSKKRPVEKSLENFRKPDQNELKKKLTPLQYKVTQESGTEKPFQNEYWDNQKEGIYVDVVSGEPLFTSLDKFKSGSGWPCFTKPIESDNIINKQDNRLAMKRIEVRSKHGDSHLGHVFMDGPTPSGTRYCINSASLRFIPIEDMEKEGYGNYLELFQKK